MPGSLNLNSMVSFSPESITLKPGESNQIDAIISIPADWPDEMVGKDVWFSLIFADSDNHTSPDLFMKQVGVTVNVSE